MSAGRARFGILGRSGSKPCKRASRGALGVLLPHPHLPRVCSVTARSTVNYPYRILRVENAMKGNLLVVCPSLYSETNHWY